MKFEDVDSRLLFCGKVLQTLIDETNGNEVAKKMNEISMAMPIMDMALAQATSKANEAYGKALDDFKTKGYTGNALTARAKAAIHKEQYTLVLAEKLESSMKAVLVGLGIQLSRLKEEEKRGNVLT